MATSNRCIRGTPPQREPRRNTHLYFPAGQSLPRCRSGPRNVHLDSTASTLIIFTRQRYAFDTSGVVFCGAGGIHSWCRPISANIIHTEILQHIGGGCEGLVLLAARYFVRLACRNSLKAGAGGCTHLPLERRMYAYYIRGE